MKKITTIFAAFLLSSSFSAQYKQKEYEKHPEQRIFPTGKFDSLDAKKRLAVGTTSMQGVAFTKPKTKFGYKAPLADRIYANHIVVELFPLSPYFQEWYDLKRGKENLKKNIIVFMDNAAYRYRLTCETNNRGEFTFPKMKPGKYILVGNLPWTSSGSYDQYTGSGYGSNGGRTDYYQRQYYSNSHNDFLMEIVEVKEGDAITKVKLK